MARSIHSALVSVVEFMRDHNGFRNGLQAAPDEKFFGEEHRSTPRQRSWVTPFAMD